MANPLLYGATVTLAVLQLGPTCRRRVAPLSTIGVSGIGALLGAVGLAFCCSPLLAVVLGLGVARAATEVLWSVSMAVGAISLVVLALRLDGGDAVLRDQGVC